MLNALGLLKERRFLPLFVTQFLGAFNDNLFKTSMVLFATYQIYNDPKVEQNFNALATAIGILPFFLLSALAGQLADTHDKARIIRIVKTAEILIMIVGSAGLLIAHGGYATPGLALMLVAVLGLGIHSAFSARSNTPSCRNICTRMKCWAAPVWLRRRPIWRSCRARWLRACWRPSRRKLPWRPCSPSR